MCYELVLTKKERDAFDWIGGRYDHGFHLKCRLISALEYNGIDQEVWDSDDDILFDIPEGLAWDIGFIGEECEYRWDCYSRELGRKLTDFCMKIV